MTFISKDKNILTTIYDKQRLIKKEVKDKYGLVIDILEPSVKRLLFKKINPFIGDEFKKRRNALTKEQEVYTKKKASFAVVEQGEGEASMEQRFEMAFQELQLEQAEYDAEFAAGEAQERMIKSKENNQKHARLLSSFNKLSNAQPCSNPFRSIGNRMQRGRNALSRGVRELVRRLTQKAGSRMQTITKKNRMRKKRTFKRKF